MSLKTIIHQQISLRRFDIASPAPELLTHQLLGKFLDRLWMTPAASNTARDSSRRNFAVCGRLSANAFEGLSGNDDRLDCWNEDRKDIEDGFAEARNPTRQF